ncbi:MAG: DALR anticodon-binding domain-containing protein, partial [Nitrospiria bacterium]
GIRYDLRDAVLARKLDKPLVIVESAEALSTFSKQAVFKSLITVYKRVARILPDDFKGVVTPDLLSHEAEKKLYTQYQSVSERVAHAWARQDYGAVLERLSDLHDPLNRFFDAVMVMDKDEAIRKNRLSLLFEIQQQFEPFGDFSKIVEEA